MIVMEKMIMKAYIIVFVCTLYLSPAVGRSPPKPGCYEETCPGPRKFYEEMGCEPVKRNPEDCCPIKYNCDHLKSRSADKCHAFGHEYNPTETLREQDKDCLGECTCVGPFPEGASWACARVELRVSTPAGCYHQRNASMCFYGPEICPQDGEEVAKCEVDGVTYYDGNYFEPKAEPTKVCWCGPGYKGENVAPFCKDLRDEKCGYDLFDKSNLKDHCAPVWNVGQNPGVHCNHMWRCEEEGDEITPREKIMGSSEAIPSDLEDTTCQIGKMTMRLGDELNQKSTTTSDCIKCRCEIPPMATCVKVPKAFCSIEELAK